MGTAERRLFGRGAESMVGKMSMSEYESLRAEIIVRIQTITALDNSVLIATGGLWVAAGAVNGILISGSGEYGLISPVIQLILLGIAALLILVATIKNWENLYQLSSASAYIKVFYEYAGNFTDRDNTNLLMWESLQMRVNAWSDGKGYTIWKKLLSIVYNGSYCFLEIATFIIMAAVIKINLELTNTEKFFWRYWASCYLL